MDAADRFCRDLESSNRPEFVALREMALKAAEAEQKAKQWKLDFVREQVRAGKWEGKI